MPVDFPSRADLYALGRSHVLARARRLDPAQVDVEGTDVNIIVASASYLAFEGVKQLIQKTNALLLDGAQNEDLDRYAFDRYQLPRKGAANAIGTTHFFRTTGGLAGSVPVGKKLITLTGIEYVTTTQATFAAADLEKFANVRAVAAGKEQQVGRNTIRRIDTPSDLFDPSLQVNNEEPTAGGEPREVNDVFRERVRDFFLTARRGTLSAIGFGAEQAEGVESARAIEVLTPTGQPARVVELLVADGSGVSNVVLGARAIRELDEYRAAGIQVIPSTSTPQIVAVQLKLTFLAGTNTATLAETVRSSTAAFVNSLPAAATLYRADLFTLLRRYVREGLVQREDSVVLPAGDLVPDAGKTLRTTLADVKVV